MRFALIFATLLGFSIWASGIASKLNFNQKIEEIAPDRVARIELIRNESNWRRVAGESESDMTARQQTMRITLASGEVAFTHCIRAQALCLLVAKSSPSEITLWFVPGKDTSERLILQAIAEGQLVLDQFNQRKHLRDAYFKALLLASALWLSCLITVTLRFTNRRFFRVAGITRS